MTTSAAVSAFTTVSIVYFNEVMKFTSTQVGICFLLILISTIPGGLFANWLGNKTNPITSLKLQLVVFIVANFSAFGILSNEDKVAETYFAGVVWGFLIGWFYPTQNVIYSRIIPAGQESQFAGFFLYCGQIMTWLPPLVFTAMNENGIKLQYGGMHLNVYLALGLFFLCLMQPWEECLEDSKENKMVTDHVKVRQMFEEDGEVTNLEG